MENQVNVGKRRIDWSYWDDEGIQNLPEFVSIDWQQVSIWCSHQVVDSVNFTV